jgi:hypothetical protein
LPNRLAGPNFCNQTGAIPVSGRKAELVNALKEKANPATHAQPTLPIPCTDIFSVFAMFIP